MISIETLGFFTGVGFAAGFVIGHCTRCRFYCPEGDEDGVCFRCNGSRSDLRAALKPDANFNEPSVQTTGAAQSPAVQPVVGPNGRPSWGPFPIVNPPCPVCKSDKTKWIPAGWNGGHWHCDKCQNEFGLKI
jgi:hypothetical protein